MALGSQSLTLNIIADDTVLKRVLADSKRNVTTFSKEVEVAGKKNAAATTGLFGGGLGRGGKLNQGLRGIASGTGLGSAALFGSGPFIGAALSAAAIKKSVDAASDLNEQITKSQQVFGASDKAILEWSKDTAKNIGVGRVAALQAAGTFGNLFKAQGFGDLENSNLSKGLVNLAGDLASFNDIDTSQVLADLQSGIVGEIEPVRKYGADLRVARVQQEALAESGKDNVKQLTNQELTLARLALLYKDTTAAQGDFKRTQGGLANQERILSAQVEDLAANLGTLLLPAVKELITEVNLGLGALIKFTDALKKIANIKIPDLHINVGFDVHIPGGKLGKIIGADFLAGTPVGPGILGVKLVQAIHNKISGDAKKASTADAPQLGNDLNVIFGGYALNVLKSVKPLDKQISDGIGGALGFVKGALQKGIKKTKLSINLSDLIDNLQLGAEKSQISGSLQTQLSALESLKGGIQKQIKAGIDVKNAQHTLVGVELQISSLQQQIKQEGTDKILGALQLGVDRAALTKGLGDDLKALEDQRDGIKAQIAAGNDVQNNQSQLVTVLGNIAQKRQEIAQAAADTAQARQFRALGLSASGGEIVPGLKNLSTRIASTLKDVSSGELNISSKLAGRLKAAQALIKKEGKNLTDATRQQINDFIKAANGDDANTKLKGPLTATTSLNTNAVLKGLGLDPAQAKALAGRLSRFNSAGVALAGSGVAATAGGFPVSASAANVTVNVELDGKKVEKSVTVRQQQRSRRNPRQKRGPTVHNI